VDWLFFSIPDLILIVDEGSGSRKLEEDKQKIV
jgi:hypothetical protein